MKILWLSWKDSGHPEAGGAELVSDAIRKRLVKNGHEVVLITAHYENSHYFTDDNGVKNYRVGSKFTVYSKARQLYRRQFTNWADIVIDEMNTIPFFGGLFVKKETKVLLTYQLARQVWFYQIIWPLSWIGYALEPLYLKLLSKKYHYVLTESQSTKADLMRFGFKSNNVGVFRVGMNMIPLSYLPKKTNLNTVLFLGAMRPMKRTLDAVKAFEVAKDNNDSLLMILAGSTDGPYGAQVLKYIESSRHKDAITIKGRVSDAERLHLMREASLIVVTSIKEGWGLVVTEAASQGTPAVSYAADGLRDSILDGKTGILVTNGDNVLLGNAIGDILKDRGTYEQLRKAGHEFSCQFTFDNSYHDFCKNLSIPNKLVVN